MTKNAQGWGFDILIASMLFLLAIILFYFYTLNNSPESEETYQALSYDGDIIADVLLSPGYPENWDSSNVITPGILTGNKINDTKLENFYNLAQTNYEKSKSLFNTRYNYYVNLSVPIIINTQIDGIGNKPVEPKNLIKTTRFTIYNNTLVSLNVYIWD